MDLQIQSSRNCEKSSLEVFDGPDDGSVRIGEKKCGPQARNTLESSGNELYLTYSSKPSLNHDDQFTIKCSISGKSVRHFTINANFSLNSSLLTLSINKIYNNT